jgi:hypothetical protein
LHYVLGPSVPAQDYCAWGAGLGAAGGMAYALLEHAAWGADGTSLGTWLGLLYGLVTGLVAFFKMLFLQRVVVVGSAALWFLAGSMVGLLIGAVFDRLFEAVLSSRGR